MTEDRLRVAREMYASGEHTVAAIAAVVGASRASVYRLHAATRRFQAGTDTKSVGRGARLGVFFDVIDDCGMTATAQSPARRLIQQPNDASGTDEFWAGAASCPT